LQGMKVWHRYTGLLLVPVAVAVIKKFTAGETDISDASRPIKTSEADQAKNNSLEYIELPVAFDGLSLMVNPKNNWVDHLTVEELKKVWAPEAQGRGIPRGLHGQRG